jgi:hypothetical protein
MKFIRNTVLAALCIANLTAQARATEFVAVPHSNHVATGNIQRAGFYTPYGTYVVTCRTWIVGYTYWGAPIWRRVCG